MAKSPLSDSTKNLAQRLLDEPDLLVAYRERRVTAQQIAQRTGQKVSYVLSTLSRLGVKRPREGASTYEIQRKISGLASIRREFRQFLAKKVKNGEISLKIAAESASCSERTMRRYVEREDGPA